MSGFYALALRVAEHIAAIKGAADTFPTSQEDGNVSDYYSISVSVVEVAANFCFFIGG
jgi:hypothetical protein